MKKIAIKITEEKERAAVGLKVLSQSQYVEEALKRAEYYRDDVVIKSSNRRGKN